MGRGAAQQAAAKFPGLAYAAGRRIAEAQKVGIKSYGWIFFAEWSIGLFQVKYEWFENADLKLIRYSCVALNTFLEENPFFEIALNYPGIGNGNLSQFVVEPVICTLSDRVTLHLKPR